MIIINILIPCLVIIVLGGGGEVVGKCSKFCLITGSNNDSCFSIALNIVYMLILRNRSTLSYAVYPLIEILHSLFYGSCDYWGNPLTYLDDVFWNEK